MQTEASAPSRARSASNAGVAARQPRSASRCSKKKKLARSVRPDALHGGGWVDAEPNQDGGELILSRLTGQPYCDCDVP